MSDTKKVNLSGANSPGQVFARRIARIAAITVSLMLAQAANAETRAWRIDTVNGVKAVGEAGLRLAEDGALSGKTGCNNFNGTAFFADGLLLVDEPMATTRMACPGAEMMAQEDTVLRVLKGAVDVAFNPVTGAMTLSKDADSLQLLPGDFGRTTDEDTSEPAVFHASYVNVFGLSGPLNIRNEPTTDARVVTRALAGTLLRNEGCEHRPDRDWCRIQFIDASGREGWAAAEYLQPAPALVRAKEGVFDRIGTVTCAASLEAVPGDCDFGLARDDGHSAALMLYRDNADPLLVSFANGSLSSVSVNGTALSEVDIKVEDDKIVLSLEDERYQFPQTLIKASTE